MPNVLTKAQIQRLIRAGALTDEDGKPMQVSQSGREREREPDRQDNTAMVSGVVSAVIAATTSAIAQSGSQSSKQIDALAETIRKLVESEKEDDDEPKAWVLRVTERDNLGRILEIRAERAS